MVLAVAALSLPVRDTIDLSALSVGEESPRTYRAFRNYQLYNPEKTEHKRREKLATIRPLFVLARGRSKKIRENLLDLIARVKNKPATFSISDLPSKDEGWERLKEVTDQVASFLLEEGVIRDRSLFNQFDYQRNAFLEERSPEGRPIDRREVRLEELRVRCNSIKEVEQGARDVVESLYPDFAYSELVSSLIGRTFRPNIVFKPTRFERKKKLALRNFEAVYDVLAEGDLIVRAGEEVDVQTYKLLRRISKAEFGFHLWLGLANLFLVALGVFFVYLYCVKFGSDLIKLPNKVGLMSLLVVLTVLVAKLIQLMLPDLPTHFEFLFPFVSVVILITILIGSHIAFLTLPFFVLIVGTIIGLKIEFIAMAILGGITGIFFSREIDHRTDLLRSGLTVAAVQALTVLFFYVYQQNDYFSLELGKMVFWSVLNGGVVVPFIVIGSLPFLENGFSITTSFKLQELADLNHPLLRELFRKAPGSYQHSIVLSNLCEQAARAIGADPLLTRVGAYYHDVGKTENPQYFTENQDQKNPHDELKPTLSASILNSHVKMGVEKAQEAGLPEVIVDFVAQHQGTTKMQSFYHKALESGADVSEDEFRYPGPIPQFKEVAILMLGDAVEAATRSLEAPNSKKIKELVESIVNQRFMEGQLNQCDLTLKDLDAIVRVFTRVLTSIHHRRESYPDQEETEKLEEGKSAADAGQEDEELAEAAEDKDSEAENEETEDET